jgi:predicted 3-demethylubiquinone-9 3-methyltransferase (glyoxalase superfamily)
MNVQKITPFLWFDTNAEEAVLFYVSIFPDSSVTSVSRYTGAGPGPEGEVMTMGFVLAGMPLTALNGGPHYKFTPAVSFVVHCDDQEEVDRYWDALLAGGGQPVQCGWLTDRFGLSWQVVPDRMMTLLQDPDRAKAQRVVAAMMKMVKLDLNELQRAYDGA